MTWDAYADIPNYSPGEWADGYVLPIGFLGTANPISDEHGETLIWWFPSNDTNPPVLSNQNPAPDEINVPRDTNITLEITDVSDGVNKDSVIITIDGYKAWDNDAYQAGFDGYKEIITDGFRYVIDPYVDFNSYELVTMRVQAQDNAIEPNSLDAYYYFRIEDYEPPVLEGQNPSPGQTDINPATNIVLEIIDLGSGVDQSSVVLTVDGYVAWIGDTQQPGFTVTKDTIIDGYRYTINPDNNFPDFKWIVVDVYAEDNPAPIANVLDTSYQFKTWDITAPFLTGLYPAENSTKNPRDGYIAFDVVDIESSTIGVSIDAYVDGYLVFDGSTGTFLSPFDDPGSSFTPGTYDGYDGYRVILQKTSDFSSYQLVSIRVVAEDFSGNPLDYTYTFRIEDFEPPTYKVSSVFPPPGTTERDPSTPVEIEIYDKGSGVNPFSINAWISNVHAYDGYTGFASGFDGSITAIMVDGYDGYRIIVNKLSPYPSADTVTVEIYAKDNEGN